MNAETELPMDEALPGRLRDCAKRVGGATKLSRITGVRPRTLQNYLDGKREPRVSTLVAVAKAAGVEVTWLATGEGASEKEVQFTDFNQELFTDCWLAIDELLQGLDKELEAADLIKLVFAVYELQILERAEGATRMNMAKVIQLVRKIA